MHLWGGSREDCLSNGRRCFPFWRSCNSRTRRAGVFIVVVFNQSMNGWRHGWRDGVRERFLEEVIVLAVDRSIPEVEASCWSLVLSTPLPPTPSGYREVALVALVATSRTRSAMTATWSRRRTKKTTITLTWTREPALHILGEDEERRRERRSVHSAHFYDALLRSTWPAFTWPSFGRSLSRPSSNSTCEMCRDVITQFNYIVIFGCSFYLYKILVLF